MRALYPGSFDPPTRGHVDLVCRALGLFDHVTVAVAGNSTKTPLFTAEERVEMLRADLPQEKDLEIVAFDGLVATYCVEQGFGALIRGVRTASDFEFEFQMGMTNRRIAPNVETVLLMPSLEFSFVSSSLIKEVLVGGGDVSQYLTDRVAVRLAERLRSTR